MSEAEAEKKAEEWSLQKLQALGQVHVLPSSIVTLGAETGDVSNMLNQFQEKTLVVKAMLKKLPFVQDSAVELVLQRACLSVGKIAHLLRANGTELAGQDADDVLQAFDAVQVE
eukprot:8547034-Karenia_brevis.AAC.1